MCYIILCIIDAQRTHTLENDITSVLGEIDTSSTSVLSPAGSSHCCCVMNLMFVSNCWWSIKYGMHGCRNQLVLLKEKLPSLPLVLTNGKDWSLAVVKINFNNRIAVYATYLVYYYHLSQ